MSNFPEIVLGTYEEFVLGYKPEVIDGKDNLGLTQSFASHSHRASVRCIATHGQYLASSGADEYINVYDMLHYKVQTVINFHSSTVTCLEFAPDGSHLISGNQNGDIAIFTCKDWSLVKYWKEAHKTASGVLSISVHPSGGLLMSAGADNVLRFWNLIKGRQAYAVNLSKKCSVGNPLSMVKWSSTGDYYIVCIGRMAEIYSTESAAVVYRIECESRISAVDFSASDVLVIGLDTGLIQIHRLKNKKVMLEEKCHNTRVKCLQTFLAFNPASLGKNKVNYLVTADSAGVIKLWRLRIKKSAYSLLLKAQKDVDCRITCLTTVHQEVKEETMD